MTTIKLKSTDRPLFYSVHSNTKSPVWLLDTGAVFAVYTRGLADFNRAFPNAVKKSGKFKLSGFGGAGQMCDVYTIPVLKIMNITVHDLPVAISLSNISADLILPSSIFKNMPFSISYQKRELNVDDGNRDVKCFLPQPFDGEYLRMNVLAQECDDIVDAPEGAIEWCRRRASSLQKELPDGELWEAMKELYYREHQNTDESVAQDFETHTNNIINDNEVLEMLKVDYLEGLRFKHFAVTGYIVDVCLYLTISDAVDLISDLRDITRGIKESLPRTTYGSYDITVNMRGNNLRISVMQNKGEQLAFMGAYLYNKYMGGTSLTDGFSKAIREIQLYAD